MYERVLLPRVSLSVRMARAFVSGAAERWAAGVDMNAVEVGTYELVSNAVLHGEGDITVVVRFDGDTFCVEVADASPDLPVVLPVARHATSRRGLNIVDAVTDRWGVEMIPDDGKVVWFTLRAKR
jgi:anti-sigma regulatory factor (Ser/Thr protein kinase)